MPVTYKLIVADDHPVFLAGLKQIIASDPQFVIVDEAGDGESALEGIRREKPDIAMLDFDLPKGNGLEIARQLKQENLPTQVMILTMHNVETLLNEALEAGVRGYLLKDNAAADILNGLRAVASGGVYISPAMSAYLVHRAQNTSALADSRPGLKALTPSERRVLKRIAAGNTSKEIGRELFISHRTVETHRSNICEKLGVHGTNKLVQFAIEHRHKL